MPAPTNKDTFAKDLYERGCEFCGAKVPAQDYFGLEHAHIISTTYAPEHRWNTIILCGSCHHIFDKVVKPRVFAALRIGATGFFENPVNLGDAPLVAAHDWKALVERLDADVAAKNPLPAIAAQKVIWKDRNQKEPPAPTTAADTSAAEQPLLPAAIVADL